MATRKPLVIISGRIQEQPEADSPAGAEPTVAEPAAAPTEKYWRGDKTWRDFFTDVRAATLTGLSTATNAVVAATDTVLAAIGKLQAQITGHVGSATGAHSASAISNTPAGGVSATTAQAAINELDSKKFDKTGGAISGGISVAGNILSTSGAIGYGVGAGGTVVQATSKSTAVTLNKPSGQITMNNGALGANTTVAFQLNNAILNGESDLLIKVKGGSVDNAAYQVWAFGAAVGSIAIAVRNISNVTLSESIVLEFKVMQGVNS